MMVMPHEHDRFLAAMSATSDNSDGNSDAAAADDDNDAVYDSVIVKTLRVYGSFYAACFVLFEILRRLYPRLYNIRRWCPSLKCQLAQENYSGGSGGRFTLFSWFWKVFQVQDELIFEQCGMDAMCFIRALRFCRKLGIFGCFNAIWLIPVYATAPDSAETAHLTSPLDIISIGNLPNQSLRFIGTIVAAYTMYFYTMYLLLQEFEWFTHWRHKFLSRRVPRSYAVYVYGIPKEYQSSYKLANYFRSCTSQSTVLEAHVAMDIPKIEKLQAERDRVIARLERVMFMEEKTGNRHMHHRWRKNTRQSSGGGLGGNSISSSGLVGSIGPGRLEKVASIAQYESELERLNREIPRRIHEVMLVNDPMRSRLNRMARSTNLMGVLEFGSSSDLEEDEEEKDNVGEDDDADDDDVEMQANVMGPIQSSASIDSSEFCTDSPRESRGQSPETTVEDNNHFETMEAIVPVAAHENVGLMVQEDEDSQSNGDVLPLDMPQCRDLRHSKQGFDLTDQDRAILSILVPEHSALFKTSHDQFLVGDAQESSALSSFMPPPSPEDSDVPSHRQRSDRAICQLIIDVPSKIDEDSEIFGNEDQDEIDNDDDGDEPTEDPMGSTNHEESIGTYPGTGGDEKSAGPPRRGDLSSIRADNHNPTSLSGKTLASRATNVTAESSVSSPQRFGNASKTSLADNIVKSTQMAKKTLTKGTRVAGDTIVLGSRAATVATKRAGQSIAAGATAATETLMKATADGGQMTVSKAKEIGGHIVKSAATMVPIVISAGRGDPRSAGFVVFTNLYAAQAALQMSHHPKPYNMVVQEAPSPGDIFWRNVGMKPGKQRLGRLYSAAATVFLCFGWSVPTAFIASLTEVNSLKLHFAGLNDLIEQYPWLENLLFQLAPVLLLILNEVFLPMFLKFFATWEGFISSAMLEASLFIKLGIFMIIQTFFVSAITGSIYAEITNMIKNPEEIMNLLSTSLPAQSNYFIQIMLASTFMLQGIELLRLYPLGCALVRRVCGPRLTSKERSKKWGWIYSLEDPPEFWHAETFAQIQVLYVMIFFVYAVISPITTFVIVFCFILLEAGYRYQFMHNYPVAFDTGGQLWYDFLQFILASMLIAQVTLVGLMILKQSKQAGPAIFPLICVTILFVIYINSKHKYVTRYLPSRDCVEIDHANAQAGNTDFSFVKGEYLQPALRRLYAEPEGGACEESESNSQHNIMRRRERSVDWYK